MKIKVIVGSLVVSAVLSLALVICGMAWAHSREVVGVCADYECLKKIPELAEVLPFLPSTARNIEYYVRPHNQYFEASFPFGESEFIEWATDVNGAPKSQRLGGSKSQRPKWYWYGNPPTAGCQCRFCGPRDLSQVSRGRCSALRF